MGDRLSKSSTHLLLAPEGLGGQAQMRKGHGIQYIPAKCSRLPFLKRLFSRLQYNLMLPNLHGQT